MVECDTRRAAVHRDHPSHRLRSCAALAGGWPPLTAPATARDFVWVGDACTAFLSAATSELEDPGAVFNVATGSQTTLRELVDVARDVFEVEAEPAWATMAPRAWDTSSWVGDPSAAAVG